MPHSRLLGLVAALAGVIASAWFGPAAARADGEPEMPAPAAGSPAARTLESLRRQEVGEDIERLGVSVDWRVHPLAELIDWRDRAQAASTLEARFAIKVDWRQKSLAALRDIGLRVATSAILASAHGVTVDWRRYSMAQLEELQLALSRVRPARPAPVVIDVDQLLAPGQTLPTRYRGGPSGDPDALIEPLFTSGRTMALASTTAAGDGDALLVPAFTGAAPTPAPYMDDGDQLLVPGVTRAPQGAASTRR
jgi:hypothetical protein